MRACMCFMYDETFQDIRPFKDFSSVSGLVCARVRGKSKLLSVKVGSAGIS